MKNHRRQFSAQFKREAVDLVGRSGKAVVRSIDGRNTVIEDTRWGAESQCLWWALIQAQGDSIQVSLREAGEVRTFREILPQQAIRVFVGATLPWTLRIAEIDLHGSTH